MAKTVEELAHLEWLGYVQPVGLVVSVPALLEAQCYINKNIMAEHTAFLSCLPRDANEKVVPEIRDLAEFANRVLGWKSSDLQEVPKHTVLPSDMSSLEVILPQYHETLRPTHVVPAFKPKEGHSPWLMLIQQLASGTALDEPMESDSARHWNAAPHAKFERLLRESGVPIGLLFNGRQLRLVYAPRGETSGYATFSVDEMAQVAGRPMFAALHMLLSADRMFSLGENQRLPYILENSRKYQNVVSTALAEQVTSALFELLRGFQAADEQRHGELMRQVLANNPQHVYHGLLTVLMRLVFVLYAEDRGLVSSEAIYTNHYSISGLFERLRSDAGRFPDTMDQRFGAWAQLLTLFRLVYEGGQHAELKIPARKGYLFDPDRYPFLEGRYDDGNVNESTSIEQSSAIQIPHVSDGIIYRVLEDLLILDGERLSYRTLDVEQIGSVYEVIMGFELQVATGKSIGIKPVKSHGAPATINLEKLLAAKPADRAKLLSEWTDQKLGAGDAAALKEAKSIDELVAAVEKKIAKHVTPGIVPAGSMVFQPSDERRRSGSHYTPRSLTQPIVRTTLEPILKQMYDSEAPLPKVYEPTRQDKQRYTAGELDARIRLSKKQIAAAESARAIGCAHPWQILELKVCDPAMGSGAFLVEACRQLGDELIKAWYAHDMVPADIPPDEDEVLYARRTVAQRCLYGVDKNIMAVDLAKLSLWLVTLAKEHPFTFLDHALRHGDSLVGLTREQIIGFHWEPSKQKKFGEDLIQKRLDKATEARVKILTAREDVAYRDQEQRMAVADEALNLIRLIGDACVSCFFAADKKKTREDELERVFGFASAFLEELNAGKLNNEMRHSLMFSASSLQTAPNPFYPFHWEVEYPEVFSRENGGFDAFVGNPPFMGGSTISTNSGGAFRDWLLHVHESSHGNADLAAHFFRRAFNLCRDHGTFGFLSTNTIGEGDTRFTGLRWICQNGGHVYAARRRVRWPGVAAVVVSIVHCCKSTKILPCLLDSRKVGRITAYLFHAGANENPAQLSANSLKSFSGVKITGSGFLFEDNNVDANPLSTMHRLIEKDHRNGERIQPYIGGEELNNSPIQTFTRYVINLGRLSEADARKWPDLMQIVEEKVRPNRSKSKSKSCRDLWWQFERPRDDLWKSIDGLANVVVNAATSPHLAFVAVPNGWVYAHSLNVFALNEISDLGVLQSRIHEEWARFLGSSMKDDLRYTPTDCFQTFPFPVNSMDYVAVSTKTYDDARRVWMRDHQVGLTSLYNRFHSPHEQNPGVLELRRLHSEMDVAVLRAYGWNDLADQAAQPDFCQFLLDYEEDEEESDSSTNNPSSTARQKKKPWRYRWPDDFRDEVLARLLELNEQRHQEEVLAGVAGTASNRPSDDDDSDSVQDDDAPKPKKPSKKTKTPKAPKTPPASGQQELEF